MDDEEREQWIEAGRIAAEGREMARELVQPGASWLEVAETIEAHIRDEGAEPAFPVNVSVDEDAAHDTPRADDERTFGDEAIVKVDVGAHIDGYIGDTATTIVLGPRGNDLAEASRQALDTALKTVRAGVNVKELGQRIQDTIQAHGAKPVSNLTGHLIERWTQHAGLSIPNIPHGDATLEEGMVIAIEPFATDGAGAIHEADDGGIYHLEEVKRQRQRNVRQAMDIIEERFDKLPFASRWLVDAGVDARRLPLVIRTLRRTGAIKSYGVLTENADGMVAQAEHTVIVEADGCTPTTVV